MNFLEFLPIILIVLSVISYINKKDAKNKKEQAKKQNQSKQQGSVSIEKGNNKTNTIFTPQTESVFSNQTESVFISETDDTKSNLESALLIPKESSFKTLDSDGHNTKHIHESIVTVDGKKHQVKAEKVERSGSLGGEITEGCLEHYDTRFIIADIIDEDDEVNFYELQKIMVLGDILNNPKFKNLKRYR